MSAQITFHRSELIGGSDFMAQAEDGRRFTVRQLIVPMIQLSDNTAANLLIAHFGVAAINAIGRRAGMVRHALGSPVSRLHRDHAPSRQRLHPRRYGPSALSHRARSARGHADDRFARSTAARWSPIMLGQTDRDGIPAALPRGTPVANKTGEIEGTRNDIAIVEPFGDSPFVLAIMTADAYDYPAAYAAIHAVTRRDVCRRPAVARLSRGAGFRSKDRTAVRLSLSAALRAWPRAAAA